MSPVDAAGDQASRPSTTPLEVKNTAFLLDRLGEDCHPLQFLRELTQNGIEAVSRADGAGEIRWDVEWNHFDAEGVYKLCVADNGVGMTGDEMVEYINHLSSSSGVQSTEGNYGVGAKIAAATRNREGLIYLSWKDGVGVMVHLWRDPGSGTYGLKQIERADGTFGEWGPVADEVKPRLIDEHGTVVVLLGNEESEDTMKAPPGARSPSRWIGRYLNTRYFRFPDGIQVKAREGWENPESDTDRNVMRRVIGQEAYLADHCESRGTVSLQGAKAHWWILKKEKATGQQSGTLASNGHVAALYQDELYEFQDRRQGTARLQQFGVILGASRVVIYVEPLRDERRLTTTTARTNLLIEREPLPWSEWAAEFRENLPDQIKQMIEDLAAGSTAQDHRKAIRERLKQLEELFRLSRYRPSASGKFSVDPRIRSGGAPTPGGSGQSQHGRSGGKGKGGRSGNVHNLYLNRMGHPLNRLILIHTLRSDGYLRETRQENQTNSRIEQRVTNRS